MRNGWLAKTCLFKESNFVRLGLNLVSLLHVHEGRFCWVLADSAMEIPSVQGACYRYEGKYEVKGKNNLVACKPAFSQPQFVFRLLVPLSLNLKSKRLTFRNSLMYVLPSLSPFFSSLAHLVP